MTAKARRRKTTKPRKSKPAKGRPARAAVTTTAGGLPVPRGPRKTRSADRGGPRLQTHKRRAVWFQARAAWPEREAPVQHLVRERARGKSLPTPPTLVAWDSVGPANIGGRMTSVVCDPTTPDRIWAGAAGGGVWHSEDAGRTWTAQWHDQEVLNVGSLALDPKHATVLYCGTGEANLSADSYPGVGIYKSGDAGKTWHLLADAAVAGIPRRIGTIAVDPFDSNRLLIGGVGHDPKQRDPGGLYVSSDGGKTWKRSTIITNGNYWCHAVVFHPSKQGTLWVTITEQGTRSGIWKSLDGGVTWTHLTNGLPDAARFGRTSLAVSPSNPDVLYAFAADEQSDNSDGLLGVFTSRDGGASWKDVANAQLRKEGQISYGNTIVVHPTDPDYVLCGGVDLYRSTNGGKTWTRTSKWDADRGKPNYAHADHHCLLMPAATPGRVYDPNDGGMDVSDDGGVTWTNRSNGLAATMFYDIDVAQSDERMFGGGAQDNGSIITADGKIDTYSEVLGGDGGWMVIDPKQAGHFYASWYNMGVFRWRPGQQPTDVSPPASKQEQDAVWMVYITLDPSNSKRVFLGSSRVWRTQNDGTNWTPVSASLDGYAISAIEVAPADPNRVYVGTEAGGLFRSTDGGKTWSANVASGVLPGHTITRIETNPTNARQLFVTVANVGHAHVFRSDDGATTWHDADGGALPDVPHHAAVILPDAQTLYVCSDAGVYVSPDLGKTWQNVSGTLPNVMVVDLVYRASDRSLFAATYGRSIYRLKLA